MIVKETNSFKTAFFQAPLSGLHHKKQEASWLIMQSPIVFKNVGECPREHVRMHIHALM